MQLSQKKLSQGDLDNLDGATINLQLPSFQSNNDGQMKPQSKPNKDRSQQRKTIANDSKKNERLRAAIAKLERH